MLEIISHICNYEHLHLVNMVEYAQFRSVYSMKAPGFIPHIPEYVQRKSIQRFTFFHIPHSKNLDSFWVFLEGAHDFPE